MASTKDPNTLSNYLEFATTHTTVWLNLSFPKSSLSGEVELRLEALSAGLKEVVLDTSFLAIKTVAVDGRDAEWSVGDRVEPYGSPLKIELKEEAKVGSVHLVKVSSPISVFLRRQGLFGFLIGKRADNMGHYRKVYCAAMDDSRADFKQEAPIHVYSSPPPSLHPAGFS